MEHEIRFLYEEDYGALKSLYLRDKEEPNKLWLDVFMNKIGLEQSIQTYEEKYNLKQSCFGKRTRKYYELSLKDFGLNHFIKEIIIGPQNNTDINDIVSYLKNNNLNANVYKSKIELRD